MTHRLAAALFLAGAALAPAPSFAQATVQPLGGDADLLAAAMRRVGANANDVDALVTAGELSLKLGDVSGAGSLFARAEKVDPMNGRVKAGFARILVTQERPGEALRYFDQAVGYGLDPRSFAADRGLAYDLIGEQRRAQADYRTALAERRDAEVVRRYALSLAIAGRKEEALTEIDTLIRAQDRGAWRARAFILAINGDQAGADKIAVTMMPPGMAGGLAPFFARLPQLSPTDRAFAVHFGEVRATPQRLADARLAPALAPLGPEMPARVAAAAPAQVAAVDDRRNRRRARRERERDVAPAAAATQRAPVEVATARIAPPVATPPITADDTAPPVAAAQVAAADLARPGFSAAPSSPRPTVAPPPTRPFAPAVAAPIAPITNTPVVVTRTPAAAAIVPADSPVAAATALPDTNVAAARPLPPAAVVLRPRPATAPATSRPAPARPARVPGTDVLAAATPAPRAAVRGIAAPARTAARVVTPPPVGAITPRLSDGAILARIIANVQLPGAGFTAPAPRRGARAADPAKATTVAERRLATRGKDRKTADAPPAAAKRTAKAEPARIWVQVAGGANEDDLGKAWKGAQAKSKSLAGRPGYATPLRATNRVVTGPFKTDAEARAFVNKLAKEGVSAFSFTSDAGQKMTKLGGK